MSAAHRALRLRMMTVERSFREEQARAIDKFLAEQRRVFEDSVLASSEIEAVRSVPVYHQGEAGFVRSLPKYQQEKEQGLLDCHCYSLQDSDAASDSSVGEEDTQDIISMVENGHLMHVSEAQKSLQEVTKKILIKPRTNLQKVLLPIVESGTFNIFSSVIVLSACFQLGVDTHYTMLCHFDDVPREHIFRVLLFWQITNIIMFMMEMAIRFAAEQKAFWCGPNHRWNIFDCCLLVIQVCMVFCPHTTWAQIRMIRLLRMVRVFEIFPDLRMMLYSLVACAGSMMWALVLIFTVFWMFACYLMETSTLYLASVDLKTKDTLKTHWNGMFLSLQSLFYSVSGGTDWGDLAEPFFVMGPFNGWIYCLFIILTLLGFLNVLVGIFMQKTNDIGSFDRDVVLGNALHEHREEVSHLHELFKEIDTDNSGGISADEFTHAMSQPRFRAYFHHLRIHFTDARHFFTYLDNNGDSMVDLQEFTDGCLRLQGAAKPADVTELLLLCQQVASKLDRLSNACPPSRGLSNHDGITDLAYQHQNRPLY